MIKQTLFTLSLAAALLASANARAMDDAERTEQLKAYQLQNGTAATTAPVEAGQGASTSVVTDTAAPEEKVTITKTVEKTTTKNYTVTKQRVGMVGYHAYPKRTETVDGGVTVERFVNDVKTDTQVVKPDPQLDQPQKPVNDKDSAFMYPFREYYTNSKGVKIFKGTPLDVKVENNGDFNN